MLAAVLAPAGLLALVVFFNAKSYDINERPETAPVSHERWTVLLQRHVSPSGGVSYQGFQSDREELDEYLQLLGDNPPSTQWSTNEQLAYWINAYNAFTIELVLDHYPVSSIKDIGSTIQLPFVNSPWDHRFIPIGDEMYTLNNIEHQILRGQFEEPRIHFAIVCASQSCPRLRNDAFRAGELQSQLEEEATSFINDPTKNRISSRRIEVSKIFQWFRADFKRSGSLVDYLNRYSETPIDPDAEINYLGYDWQLNEAKDL